MMPMNRAKKMIASMSPEASAWMGFFGMMFKMVSTNDTSPELESPSVDVSPLTRLDISTPLPGLIAVPTKSATDTASAVVQI